MMKKWQMVANVNRELDIEGQSSEYTDSDVDSESNESPALCTTIPKCRRRIISDLMEDLDQAINEHIRKQSRHLGKRYVPKPSRVRHRTRRISDRTVKRSLPRSCYHRRFLAGLAPNELAMISPRDEEIPIFSQYADGFGSDSMEED